MIPININNIDDVSLSIRSNFSKLLLIERERPEYIADTLKKLAVQLCKDVDLPLFHYIFSSSDISDNIKEDILSKNNLLLSRACQYNQIPIVHYLLTSPTIINLSNKPQIEDNNYDAIGFAIRHPQGKQLVEILLNEIKDETFSFNNYPNIFVDVGHGSVDTLKTLLTFERSRKHFSPANMEQLFNVINKAQVNLLIIAALEDKNHAMLKYLIETPEIREHIDFKYRSEDRGLNVFNAAAKVGAIENVKYLWNLQFNSNIKLDYDIENTLKDLIEDYEYDVIGENQKNEVIKFLILKSAIPKTNIIEEALSGEIPISRRETIDKIFNIRNLERKLQDNLTINQNIDILKNKI